MSRYTNPVAVVTTRNEEATIRGLVSGLSRVTEAVVVVDAASTDSTAERADAAGAYVIGRDLPIGPALMLGWRFAAHAFSADRIIQIDAGGSHDWRDAPAVRDHPAPVVVGSRFCKGASHRGNRRRAFASRAAAWAYSVAAFHHLTDWTSGFRAFDTDAALALADRPYVATMHGWQPEVLAQALLLGIQIGETPISYQAGRSSLNRGIVGEAIEVGWNILWTHT